MLHEVWALLGRLSPVFPDEIVIAYMRGYWRQRRRSDFKGRNAAVALYCRHHPEVAGEDASALVGAVIDDMVAESPGCWD